MRQRDVRRYATSGFGVWELLFYGGLIYGWANLVFVLKADGYYSDLCVNGTIEYDNITERDAVPPTCSEQDARLNLVFTVGVFSVQGLMFFNGMLFDYFGTIFTRLFLHFLLASGLIMMSFSSPSIPVLLFPGMVCISVGGIQLLLTNIQIGNLFGRRRATAMTAFAGCLDSSSLVMLLIKVGYEGGISLQTSFAILAGATLVLFINTFLLLPKRHIPWPLPQDWERKKKYVTEIDDNMAGTENIEEDKVTKGTTVDDRNTEEESRQLADRYRNKDFPTLKSCICSPLFFLFVLWFSILQLRLLYFLGTLNPFLNQIADKNDEVVSKYSTIFGFYQICGIFVAPFSGLILDRNKTKKVLSVRGPYEDIRDSGLAFTATTLLYVVFSILNAIPVLEVLYVTYLLHIFTRGFMFGLAAAGIPIFFPGKYFGTLYGLLVGIGSVIGLLQFPLFIASQKYFNNDPLVINLVLMVACVFTIALPVYIHFYVKRKTAAAQLEMKNEINGVENPVKVVEDKC